MRVDHRWLFKYVSESRKANVHSVNALYQERLQKTSESGREITGEVAEEIREQATREMLKYSPITVSEVFILFDEKAGKIWCSGNTPAKCEKALTRLRRAIGTLKTAPLIFDNAGKILARYLSRDLHSPLSVYQLPECLQVPEHGKAVAIGNDGEKVLFDGISLRENAVREMLSSMEVTALEMFLANHCLDRTVEEIAHFELQSTSSGRVNLKGLSYEGSAADQEGDASHHYATEIIIISRIFNQVFSGLRGLFV
ncbi:recombination-associated protein RdgC (plasmid) [Rouxiella badensis]|nr:recombination-associated protein RdgC [Rouxiella badensis]